ncbi:uncharacterized membrane-anchored protein YjiN (DUF445 family) [Flavobacterium sp. 7E]|uniref:DUF445 domain-containing protein n=1 Tax=Flavobacterium sp. 7E TaxID=2735898 RepID=UPI00156F204D|nr:DUF445 domain-containing protein [Flavobacterium sp. 7E]NRS88107.1 uncharacterized membrane-anchored protein YjiN (DUF445 family) [Flavobacterium sp. 7E]
MKNNLGSISLLIAFGGLVFFEVLLRLHILNHQAWKIVTAGFEAATIGGFADWFAVSALFHEIPIPFVRKHTNIIAKNREKLTEGIVDLVTNKWLSPDVIAEKLNEVDLAKTILDFMQQPKNQQNAIIFIQNIVSKFTTELDNPKFAAALQKILREQISTIDLATPLGKWLEKSIKNGDHHQIWELIIDESSKSITNPETKKLLISKLKDAADEYSDKGFFKKATLFIAEKSGGIDLNLIADELLDKAKELISEAKLDVNHPIRTKFDNWILEFAKELSTGDEQSTSIIQNLKERVMQHVEDEKLIATLLLRAKATLSTQLENKDTSLMQFLISNLNRMLTDLQEDVAAQQKINSWIRETISEMLVKFHSEIGNMVRSSMMKLNNKELVEQIEDKVGNDLQYIRLNGAVVGGLVGIVLALLKLL